jgi:hypothetical protein
MKKVFIISSVLFFLVGSFYLAYNFLLKDNGANNKNDNIVQIIEDSMEGAEVKSEKKLKPLAKIIDTETLAISIDKKEGKLLYYNLESKGFWWASFDGSFKKKISNDDLVDLKEINWSENGEKALLKMADSYYLYTFEEREKMIKKSKALSWLNFGEEIVYVFDDLKNGKKTINVANLDGTNWKELSEIKNDNLIMQSVPRSSKTAFWIKPDAFLESDMTVVSAGGMGLEKKGDLKYGVDYLWSPEGDRFLRSYVSEKGGNNLILESCEARDIKCTNLGFPTIASKCAWFNDGKNIACAQIKNLAVAKVMPNDYMEKKIISDDLFWKINIEEGKREKLVEEKDMEESVDATNLIFSPKNDFLFFINRKDNKLFRVEI